MTRFLIGLIIRIALACGVIVLLAMGLGHILPPEDELAFASNFPLEDYYKSYIMVLNRQIMIALDRDKQDTFPETWSPDGERIIISKFVDGLDSLFEISLSNGAIQRLTDGQHYYASTSWSPDGRFLIFQTRSSPGKPSELTLFDVQTGTTRQLTYNSESEFDPNWSPNSLYIVFAAGFPTRNNDIYELDIQTGIISPLLISEDNKYSPTWSPDGRYLFYTVDLNTAYVWDATNKHSILLLENMNLWNTVDWSPDGRFITYVSMENLKTFPYVLDVEQCIEQPETCQPKRLFNNTSYSSPHWRPHQP